MPGECATPDVSVVMIEALLVTLPLILIALARLVEAAAIVILARRADAPLVLSDERTGRGGRLRLRARVRPKTGEEAS